MKFVIGLLALAGAVSAASAEVEAEAATIYGYEQQQ